MFSRLLLLSSRFYKIAGKLDDTISAMNLSNDIQEFLMSVPDSEKGFYIGALKKNPKLSLDELKQTQIKTKEKEIPIEFKDFISKYDQKFGNWIVVQFKKLKKEYNLQHPPTGSIDDCETWEDVVNHIGIRDRYRTDQSPLSLFYHKIDEINDWIKAENIEITSWSAQQAIDTSNAWHKEIAERGKNKTYQEGTSNIVYGPNWQNPEFNGWTIRKVKTANDLDVEGNKMNHCVGSYAEEVNDGGITVYSLRDPSNNPHVTMGSDSSEYNFVQIKGNSNQPPKQKYKKMIREWFDILREDGRLIEINEEDSISDNWEEAQNQIKNLLKGQTDYGTDTKSYDNQSPLLIIDDFQGLSEKNNGKNNEIIKLCANILHEKDKQLLQKITDEANANPATMGSTEFIFERKWRRDSSCAALDNFSIDNTLNSRVMELSNDENYSEIRDTLMQNEFPFNFYYGLIDELKKINATDPIPHKEWMGEYYYDRL